MSFVYFIEASTDSRWGYVKIGVAADPHARIVSMQTGNPLELTLIGQIPGGAALEARLHVHFKKLHVRGEWFNLDYDMNRAIARILAGGVEFVLDKSHWLEKFKRFLSERNISAEAMCVDTGIKLATFQRIVDGKAFPTRQAASIISDFTGGFITDDEIRYAMIPTPVAPAPVTETGTQISCVFPPGAPPAFPNSEI